MESSFGSLFNFDIHYQPPNLEAHSILNRP